MTVTGGKRLHFIADLDTRPLAAGAAKSKGIVAGMGRSFKSLAPFSSLGLGAAGVGIAAGAMFTKITKQAYKFSNDFSKAMREVQTISKAVQEDFEGIGEAIVNISATDAIDDAIGLAEAFYQIVSAGKDGAEGLDLLAVSSRAAIAGISDTKTAADGLTTVLNAWSLASEEATQVSDVMFKTVELGKTTFGEIATAISQVAPLAASLEVPFEEISGALASITKQGTPTAMAITQIRSALIAMNENLGDGWGQAMSLQEAFQAVRDMAGGSDIKLQKLMGRIEGMNAVLALTGDKAKMAADDLNAMYNATGAAESAYDKMMLEADNKWSLVHNKWNRELKAIGDSALVASKGLADFFNQLLTNRQTDIIDPKIADNITRIKGELAKLNTEEERRALLVKEIGKFQEAQLYYGREIKKSEGEQPGWLQQTVETGNRAVGLGMTFRPGEIKESDLDYWTEQYQIQIRTIGTLKEQFKELSNIKPPDQTDAAEQVRKYTKELEKARVEHEKLIDSTASNEEIIESEARIVQYQAELNKWTELFEAKGGKIKITQRTVFVVEEEIENLEKRLGKGTVEQEVDLILKIANLTEEKDALYQKIRDGLAERLHADIDIKPMVSKVAVINTKEVTATLKPMKLLTEEQKKQLQLQLKIVEANQKRDQNIEDTVKGLSDANELLGAMSYAASQFDEELGKSLGTMADIANNAANLIANLATDPISAIASGIGIIGNIISLFKDDDSDSGIEKINKSLEEQNRILDSSNTLDWLERVGDVLITVNKQADAAFNSLQKISLGKIIGSEQIEINGVQTSRPVYEIAFTGDWTPEDWSEYYSKFLTGDTDFNPISQNDINDLEEYGSLLNQSNLALDRLEEERQIKITGVGVTEIAESILTGIEEGYKVGSSSWTFLGVDMLPETVQEAIENGISGVTTELKDFSETFGELMETSLRNHIKTVLEDKVLIKFMEEFTEAMSDGILTEGEIEDLKTNYAAGVRVGQEMWEAAMPVLEQLGVDSLEDEQAGSTGAIRGITEETAGLIAGQFTAMRADLSGMVSGFAEQADFFDEFLDVQKEIALNTGELSRLENIEKQMTEMNATVLERL